MEKKIPMRTCIACRKVQDKREMYRIVKSGDKISLDKTGKANGRGAYICHDPQCLKKAIKSKALERAFSTQIPPEIYDKLNEQMEGGQ